MKKYLISLVAILISFGSIVYASQPVFTSPQVGASPSNGYVLQTNGLNSTWVATSTLGIAGGGGTVTSIATNNGITGGTITTTGTIGLAAIAANSVLGNTTGTSAIPSAIATSSLFLNAGVSTSGLLTSTDWNTFNSKLSAAITSIGPAGQLQTGATQTLATTTSAFDGLTSAEIITATGNTITWKPSLSGKLTVAGGGTGQSTFTSSQLIYGNGTTALSSVATSTLTASSPLTGSFVQIGSSGSLGCQTASDSQAGCLSSADWTTFNNKGSGTVTAVTGTYPVVSSGGVTPAISLAFGTTTANSWSQLQQFNGNASTTALTISGNEWLTVLGSPAGAYLAVDPNGKVIATTTPSGGGAVSSVSNSDSTLSISPTTGAVVASLNTAILNHWSKPIDLAAGAGAYQIEGSNFAYGSTTNADTILGLTAGGPNAYSSGTIRYLTAVGYAAAAANTTGNHNTSVGFDALTSNTSGAQNTALGDQSLFFSQTGQQNVGVGYLADSGTGLNAANGNTAVGWEALLNNAGSNNIAIGVHAGSSNTSGADNIIIGQQVNALSATANSQLNIGNVLYGNNLYAGATASAAPVLNPIVGVGSTSPYAEFSIHAPAGSTNATLFAIGSSTVSATTTLFSIDNTGSTTAANGFNINAGCYAVNGTCLSFQAPGNYITALTGDGTASGPGSAAFTLSNVNSNVGTFTYPSLTVNAKGLVTAISSQTPVTSLAQTYGTAQTGAITFATTTDSFNGLSANETITNSGGAFTFANNITGTLNVGGGGTGVSSLAAGHLLYGSGSTAMTDLGPGTAGQVLSIVAGVPAWVATSTGTNYWTSSGGNIYNNTGTNVGIASSTPWQTLSVGGNIAATGTYYQFGNQPVLDSFYCTTSQQCLAHTGSDNTLNGVEIENQNSSGGAHAYAVYTLQNNLTDNSGLHYAGWSLNSSNYSDATFGTALNVPNLAELVNADGATTFATNLNATTTANSSYFNWLIGGSNTSNELMRLTPTGLGIGSTSPNASLSINGSIYATNNIPSVFGTNTPQNGFFSLIPADNFWIATSTAANTAVRALAVIGSSAGSGSTAIQGFNASAIFNSSATANNTFAISSGGAGGIRGGRMITQNDSNGYNVLAQTAMEAVTAVQGTLASTTAAIGFFVNFPSIAPGDLISNFYGVRVHSGAFGGTLTSQAGLDVGELTAGTNNTGLLLGTETIPTGNYGLYDASANANYFASNVGIGTTTPYAILSVLSGSNTLPAFAVSTTTGADVMRIDAAGHLSLIGPSPAITSCGTNPSVVGPDNAFQITIGTVAATGCTATFARAFVIAPVCTVTNQSMSITSALTYTISTTAVVLSQATGLVGDKVDIVCVGRQ